MNILTLKPNADKLCKYIKREFNRYIIKNKINFIHDTLYASYKHFFSKEINISNVNVNKYEGMTIDKKVSEFTKESYEKDPIININETRKKSYWDTKFIENGRLFHRIIETSYNKNSVNLLQIINYGVLENEKADSISIGKEYFITLKSPIFFLEIFEEDNNNLFNNKYNDLAYKHKKDDFPKVHDARRKLEACFDTSEFYNLGLRLSNIKNFNQ